MFIKQLLSDVIDIGELSKRVQMDFIFPLFVVFGADFVEQGDDRCFILDHEIERNEMGLEYNWVW